MKDGSLRAFLAIVFVGLGLLQGSGAAADAKQTLTGEVSDSTCSVQHMRPASDECTRFCVGHGAKYMLVVGDKLYSLNTADKALLATLDKQAGKRATVTGTVHGVGVDVATVEPAK